MWKYPGATIRTTVVGRSLAGRSGVPSSWKLVPPRGLPITGRLIPGSCGVDAGHRANARHGLTIELETLLSGISRGRDRHTHREHVVCVESQVRAIQRNEGAHEHTGAAQEDDRHGDLHDDEPLPYAGRVTGL